MDIQKDRNAFESWFESRYGANFMQFVLDLDMYVNKHTQSSWEAWQAAKAQAVPGGFVVVPVCEYCGGYGEVGCQFEGTFTCPECNGDRVDLKAMIEAQEQSQWLIFNKQALF